MLCKNNFDQITEALRYFPLSQNISTTTASSDASYYIPLPVAWLRKMITLTACYSRGSSAITELLIAAHWHINKEASHVPNKSLCKAPVVLMPVDL